MTEPHEPTVSACVAVYNGSLYLKRALDSIVAQTRPPNEIIVLDDGSSDDSAEIAESYPGVRVLRQENSGIGAARRRLVEEAVGEWIAFCDHDDWWEPDKLAKQLPHTSKPEVVVVYSPWEEVDEHGNRSGPVQHAPPDSLRLLHFVPHQELSPSATLIRRSAILDVGNYLTHLRIGEDTLVFFRLLSKGVFIQVPGPLSHMLKRSDSTSSVSRSLYEHARIVLEDYVLKDWDRMYWELPADQSRLAKRLTRRNLAYIKSQLGLWLAWEGKWWAGVRQTGAAVRLNPRSPGNWYRFVRTLTGLRLRPHGATS